MTLGVQPRREHIPPELFDHWYAAERVEPCCCGGFLRADPTSERRVREEIETHQRSERHRQWRDAGMPGLGR